MTNIVVKVFSLVKKALRSGQFTSPNRVNFRYGLGYAIGEVDNDSNNVQAVIRLYSKAGQVVETFTVDLDGVDEKPEGPGLELIARETEDGYDVDVVVTAHANAYNQDGSRDNFIASGTIAQIVRLPDIGDFNDVPRSDWSYPFVRAMARRGIISGYSDGGFRPGGNVTRAQLAKILFYVMGLGN